MALHEAGESKHPLGRWDRSNGWLETWLGLIELLGVGAFVALTSVKDAAPFPPSPPPPTFGTVNDTLAVGYRPFQSQARADVKYELANRVGPSVE